ncbi:tryptophan synthase subunit alpha [Sorangium sp. So ce1182]|uniref:tryptophan synthase subunit alpha n=1 Tax=Sorangium sp. So ce1182 TaxID=3133334 RepID=UPI003F62CDDE
MSREAMTTRYDRAFERLRQRGEGAFIPFLMLGDPDLATSARLLRAVVEGGADAIEVGIPFSDPIADGPTIQAAAVRALGAGVRPADCIELLRQFRAEAPEVPVGILTYANLVKHRDLNAFYATVAAAGVDSVLVADVPVRESEPYVTAARAVGVAPVLIAPLNASEATLQLLSERCAAYTYCVTRKGVTGADDQLSLSHGNLLETLRRFGAPPAILGFGISKPEHVRAALAAGAFGVISGSAVVQRIASNLGDPEAAARSVASFVREMKAATAR